MSILQARGLALRFAQEHPLFHDVDFDINPGDRIALTGPNGAGKSTLLQILAGALPPDAGALTRRRGLVTATFSQSNAAPDEAIYEWPEDVEPLLRGLGFDTEQLYTPLSQLSAGQRARARLARALAAPADLLLLDEPTNHLDAKARRWLESHLLRHQPTCLFVSHDEDFLTALATRVFRLERGRFDAFQLDYAAFLEETETRHRQCWHAFEDEQRRLAAFDRAARARDAVAAKTARRPADASAISSPFYKAKAARVARTARLLRERLPPEQRVAKPWEDDPIPTLDFANTPRPGDPALHIENLTLAYAAAPIVAGVNLTVRRQARVHLAGPNGSGKTTLFRAILGQLPPAAGRIQTAANVKLGYFAQEAETLDPAETPLDACLRCHPDRTWIQTILACLKLPRDYARVPIAQLSLGERAKTALAQILVSGANLLLLDEPTNHLEIEARRALVETLDQFPGAILFTSHDPAFVEAVATETVALS